MPASVNDIIDAAHANTSAITDQIMTTGALDPAGNNADVQNKLDLLRAKRQSILNEADGDVLRSDQLDAALGILNSTASSLVATAANMTTLTGLATNFNTYVGYANGAITTLQGIQKDI